MMDRLRLIEAFVQVAEEGSFSAAARVLGTSQPSVTKSVAELEAHLRTGLFHRTTRKLSLTAAGSAYYTRMKALISLLSEADEEAGSAQTSLRGPLRVTTSAVTAPHLVVPALLAFKSAFPGVDVEITMDDRRIDPVEQSTDIAVRIGPLPDSTLRVRRAGEASMGIFASPGYLAHHGAPAERPSDLARHQIIQFADRKAMTLLADGALLHGLETQSAVTVSNLPLAKEVALGGGGLAMLPHFLVGGELADRLLVQVIPDLALPGMEVSLLHPFSQAPPKRVATFIDFAIELWRDQRFLR